MTENGYIALAGAVVRQALTDLESPAHVKAALARRDDSASYRSRINAAKAMRDAVKDARGAATFLLREMECQVWGQLIGDTVPRLALRKEVLERVQAVERAGITLNLRIRPMPRPTCRARRSPAIRPDVRARVDALLERVG